MHCSVVSHLFLEANKRRKRTGRYCLIFPIETAEVINTSMFISYIYSYYIRYFNRNVLFRNLKIIEIFNTFKRFMKNIREKSLAGLNHTSVVASSLRLQVV